LWFVFCSFINSNLLRNSVSERVNMAYYLILDAKVLRGKQLTLFFFYTFKEEYTRSMQTIGKMQLLFHLSVSNFWAVDTELLEEIWKNLY